jgi:exopolyphosphatase/guanosine-5'-triphosphate,3'-diphosphate pyrophosphatase
LTALRWEWRTFGEQFGGAEDRLGSIDPERLVESDETYLLSAEGVDAVKVRDDLVDLKHLEQVNDDGLELWRPVMKSPLPISAADARTVLAALRIAGALDSDTYDFADLTRTAGGAVRVVPVHKKRRHFTIARCMAELTDLRTSDR